MKIHIGQAAPDFTLYDTEKQEVNLHSLKGNNIVLLFFPLAFTGTCTKELCWVRDHLAEFNMCQARVLAISVDSVYSLARYKEEQKLNFSLLSDFNKEVSLLYDSLYESFSLGMKGVSKRSAFVVNKSGILCYSEILENAREIPNFQAINHILQGLE